MWYKKRMNLNFCIAGGRGFIGKILRKELSITEERVLVLSRKLGSATYFSNNEFRIFWDGKNLDSKLIEGVDVFINLSGENIFGRLNKAKKDKILRSRIEATRGIVNSILKVEKKPKYFFQASAVGIYKGEEGFIDENSPLGDDFLAEVVKGWEMEVEPLKNFPINLFIMRFGVVLGKNGGIYKKLNKYFKLGIGAILGDGNYHIPWIYENEVVSIFKFLINNAKGGVYNFVSPKPITAKELFKAWGRAYKKPVFLYIPFFLINIFLGKESKNIWGKDLKVIPKALLNLNFNFSYDNISNVFEELSKK